MKFSRAMTIDLVGTATTIVVVAVIPPIIGGNSSFLLQILFLGCIYAAMGHAWNLLAGYAGLLSFGNQAFVGLGGYGVAVCLFYWNLNVWLGLLIAAAIAAMLAVLLAITGSERDPRPLRIGIISALAAWILYEILLSQFDWLDVFQDTFVRRVAILLLIFLASLPLFRLDGAYFAVATWLVAASLAAVFNEWTVVGAGGGLQVRSNLDLTALFYGAAALVIVTTLALRFLERSRIGLALTAIRDNQQTARAAGINVERTKGYALVLAAAITAFAGGLFYLNTGFITPSSGFDISWSAFFVLIAVSGGLGRLWGPIFGAALFVFIDQYVTDYIDEGLLVLGLVSIAVVFLLPEGIVGLWRRIQERVFGSSKPIGDLKNIRTSLSEHLKKVSTEGSPDEGSTDESASNRSAR